MKIADFSDKTAVANAKRFHLHLELHLNPVHNELNKDTKKIKSIVPVLTNFLKKVWFFSINNIYHIIIKKT